MLVLASQSAARRAMLTAAGVPHLAVAAQVDEESTTASLIAAGAPPRDIADALAELKALAVSQARPDDMVLGCDSVVALADGTLLDKPRDRADAARQLRRLSGQAHRLISAAVIAERGAATWRLVDTVELQVRALSDDFIDRYLDAEWPAISGCVGGYRVEAMGVQLFAAIRGSHYTIMGLPLLPLLAHLRQRGVLPS